MKILTPEEASKVKVRQRGNVSPAYSAVFNLPVGQTLHLEPSDWNQKSSPGTMVRRIMRNHKRQYTFASISNGPGWLITRLN